MSALKQYMDTVAKDVEKLLAADLESDDPSVDVIWESMRYSALAGGKRLRPFLCVATAEMLHGDRRAALFFGAALEMIHTYSLIHDDLPCMDNDDLRRGKPTCHKVYGDATALLAGDALLTEAFSLIAHAGFLSAEDRVSAISILTEACGNSGMIGGQVMDMRAEQEEISIDELHKLHSLKTGALIVAAARLGLLAAHVDDPEVQSRAVAYAGNVGMAFQIVDDWLDVYGEEELLGKPIGSDSQQSKTTFMSFFDKDEAMSYAGWLTDRAIESIVPIQGSEMLQELARTLLNRKK